jgi:hypothetical protein
MDAMNTLEGVAILHIHGGVDDDGAELVFDFNGQRISVSVFPSSSTHDEGEDSIQNRTMTLLNRAIGDVGNDEYEELTDEVLGVIMEAGKPILEAQGALHPEQAITFSSLTPVARLPLSLSPPTKLIPCLGLRGTTTALKKTSWTSMRRFHPIRQSRFSSTIYLLKALGTQQVWSPLIAKRCSARPSGTKGGWLERAWDGSWSVSRMSASVYHLDAALRYASRSFWAMFATLTTAVLSGSFKNGCLDVDSGTSKLPRYQPSRGESGSDRSTRLSAPCTPNT